MPAYSGGDGAYIITLWRARGTCTESAFNQFGCIGHSHNVWMMVGMENEAKGFEKRRVQKNEEKKAEALSLELFY